MTLSTFVTSLGLIGGTVANTDTSTDTSYLFISTKISGDSYIFKLKLSDGTQYAHSFGNGGIIGIYGSYIYYTYMNDSQPKLGRLLFDYDYTSDSMTDDGSIDVRFNGIQHDVTPDYSYTEFIDKPVGVVSVSGYLFYIHSSGYISRFTVSSITENDVTVNDGDFGSTSNGYSSTTASETNSAGYSDLGGALTGASPSCLASDGTTYVYIGCSTKILKMTTNGTYDSEIASGLSYAVSSMSVSGNYLYALLADDSVFKIDLTNTTSTSTFISNGLLTNPNLIANIGDYLYISDSSGNVLRSSTITTVLSNDTSVTVSVGDIGEVSISNDVFTATLTSYTTSVLVSAVKTDTNATVTVSYGNDISSDSLTLTNMNTGNNTVTIVVTAEDTSVVRTITGTIYVPSNDTTLSNITVYGNSNQIDGFNITADAGTSSVGVSVTPTDSNVTSITINGTTVTADNSYYTDVYVSDGSNNTITIRVTAEDGTTYTDYSGTVYVTPTDNGGGDGGGGGGGNLSTDSSLSSLTVDSEPVTGYNITVGADITSISVAAIPNVSSVQSVTINGTSVSSPNYSTNVSISYGSTGSTDIPIVVMAEDGSSTSYTLTVAMTPSSDTSLSAFTINTTSMGTNGGGEITVSYGATVSVYVATTSSYAYIDVNGDSQTTGTKTTTLTGLSVGTHTITVHIVPQNEGDGAYYTATVIVTSAASITCFEENTKILCFNNETSSEEYVTIKDLRKGDLVKTVSSGYKAINMIGKRDIYHPSVQERIKNQLYKCSTEKYPELFEDLIITGCHSILVKEFASNEEKEKTIEINGNTYVTEKHYRLPACADERASVYEESGNYTIYHIALDNEDYYMNYGVYANGLLVETSSQRYLKELSGMELIE